MPASPLNVAKLNWLENDPEYDPSELLELRMTFPFTVEDTRMPDELKSGDVLPKNANEPLRPIWRTSAIPLLSESDEGKVTVNVPYSRIIPPVVACM